MNKAMFYTDMQHI